MPNIQARIQNKIDTASNWTSVNPILLNGEIGIEKDTGQIKIGNGTSAWNNLEYYIPNNSKKVNNLTVETAVPPNAKFTDTIYSLPTASTSTRGGVKIDGTSITINNGVISSTKQTSVSGNAGTATKLATARTISLAGDLSGSASFDGSANVSITASVVDDSHNHIISNIDGLQTTLNEKASLNDCIAMTLALSN